MQERILENLTQLILLGILVGISGAVSASETALFSLTRTELARIRQSKGIAAQGVVALRAQPRSLLSTVLLTNTTVNILLYSVLGVTCARLGGGSGPWTAAFGIGGFVVTLFAAEILPKQIALVIRTRFALAAALPLRMLRAATAPIRWLLEHAFVEPLTRIISGTPGAASTIRPEELQQLIELSQAEGLIDDREKAMLHRVMELAETRVSALMVPRVDFVAFNIDDDPAALVDLIRRSRLMRIPVYEKAMDNVIGAVFAKDFLLNRSRPLRELLHPVLFIPEQASVDSLLEHFRGTGSQLAIVVDEYGGLAGVVALEDVAEAIVGDIAAQDEAAAAPPLERLDATTFLVDGGLNVDDFRRAFRLPLEETRVDTVGGLIVEKLGRVPTPGDEVMVGPLCFSVTSVRKRRILRARITLDAPPADNPDLSVLLGAADGHGAAAGRGPGAATVHGASAGPAAGPGAEDANDRPNREDG